MKAFIAPLAAIVLGATAIGAQAFPAGLDAHLPFASGPAIIESDNAPTLHDLNHLSPCLGLASGTAHHSCGGTATGGPVGGLS